MPKFTLKDYDAQMEEIRNRLRQKPVIGGQPTDLLGRLREAVKRRGVPSLPKLPKI